MAPLASLLSLIMSSFMQRTFAQLCKSLLLANLFSTTASGPQRTVLPGAFCQRCRPFSNFISLSLIGVSQRSSWFTTSLRSFALAGFMVMVSSDMESFVDLAWNQHVNTLQASNPLVFNTALSLTPALPLHTFCRRGESASDTSLRFQSKGFPRATWYASTSRKAAGPFQQRSRQ